MVDDEGSLVALEPVHPVALRLFGQLFGLFRDFFVHFFEIFGEIFQDLPGLHEPPFSGVDLEGEALGVEFPLFGFFGALWVPVLDVRFSGVFDEFFAEGQIPNMSFPLSGLQLPFNLLYLPENEFKAVNLLDKFFEKIVIFLVFEVVIVIAERRTLHIEVDKLVVRQCDVSERIFLLDFARNFELFFAL